MCFKAEDILQCFFIAEKITLKHIILKVNSNYLAGNLLFSKKSINLLSF